MRALSLKRNSFCRVFNTADHISVLATYLSVPELLTASELSRSLHAPFDSDAAWRDKVQAITPSATAAGHVGDGEDERSDKPDSKHSATATGVSATAKQRCIDLRGCSEHVHNQCYKLVAPEAEGSMPLCASCRTAIAACIVEHLHDSIDCVLRLSASAYYVYGDHSSGCKAWTDYWELEVEPRAWAGKTSQRSVERRKRRRRPRTDYRAVRLSRSAYNERFAAIINVCSRCDAGLKHEDEEHRQLHQPAKWCMPPWEHELESSSEEDEQR